MTQALDRIKNDVDEESDDDVEATMHGKILEFGKADCKFYMHSSHNFT